VWQQFASFASQVVRLYVGTGHVEMEYTIGPIPIRYSDTHPILCLSIVAIVTIKVKKSSAAMPLPWQLTKCGTLMLMAVK